MNELQLFKNEEFGEIRTIEESGKILFCASDVAKSLGYSKPNNAVEAHCRYTLKRGIPHPQSTTKTIDMIFIPEGDVYRLVARSSLPGAEKFESWIFDEVLPMIRATGGAYLTQSKMEQLISDPDLVIGLCEQVKTLRANQSALELELEVAQPKLYYHDLMMVSPGLLSATQIAKEYGWSARKLNKQLYEMGIQFKQGDQWFLYAKYAGNNYTKSQPHPIKDKEGNHSSTEHTYWTEKGKKFIYEELKKIGILPMIEREALANG